MTKVTLNDLTNLNNQQSSINTINGNNTTIETAFDNTLSRDGSNPNQMEATLDMNSNHVINLPEPASYEEPLRLGDITNFIDQFALVQTPSPGDAGKIIRVRADEIAYDISSTIVDATTNNLYPVTNDTGSLGTTTNKWADLFLASGSVINFNSGDITITHSSNNLLFAGASSGYTFDAKVYPTINDGAALGDTTHNFSDLFLASGAVINFNAGDVAITHSADNLAFSGGTYSFDNKLFPAVDDGAPLGDTTHKFSDLFLASGAVINFNNGDVTITHSSNVLAFAGASTNYTFDANVNPATSDGAALGTTSLMWSDLFLASGAVINFNNGDVTLTHSSDQLTIGGLGAYTIGSTGGLQVNQDIVTTGGAIYALGGSIPTSATVAGVYFGKESANTNRAIQIVTPTSGSAYIDFAPTSVDFDGRILVDTSAHTMEFSVNGAAEVKLTSTDFSPSTSDGNALGTTSKMWGDLFLASGGIINFNNGDVTVTHATDTLSFAGATTYNFDNRVTRDSTFFFDLSGGNPLINFDTNDDIFYDRTGNIYNFVIGASTEVTISATDTSPGTSDGNALGTSSKMWSDLFLASGAVVNFNNGDVTLTHSATNLAFAGGTYQFDGKIYPTSNDGAALGDTTHNFSDLFLASGAVINFNAGDVTVTHASDNLLFAGASSGYTFDAKVYPTTNDGAALGDTTHNFSDLFLASGAVINFNANDVTVTHSSGKLTNSGHFETQKTFQMSGFITASLTADTNDWAPTGNATASSFLVSSTGGWNLTGIAGGTAGRLLLVFNVDVANTFTIKANNGSSSAANRIQCGTDLNLAPGTGCLLYYETSGNFWRLIGGGSGGGGVTNAYGSMTDGTTTANASGSDTFKFRVGSTGGITAAVGSNDVTHGDNLLISLNINGLTADTTPDSANDYVVTYDASASAHKKVLLNRLGGSTALDQQFGSTQGQILYRGASAWTVLNPGNQYQVLTTNGGSANPQWSSGSVVLASGNLSGNGTALNLTGIPSSFRSLQLQISGCSSSSTANFLYRVSTNNGSSYDSTTANYLSYFIAGTTITAGTTATLCSSSISGAAGTVDCWMNLFQYGSGTYPFSYSWVGNPTNDRLQTTFYVGSTSAINAIQVSCSAGSFDAGTYVLLGVY